MKTLLSRRGLGWIGLGVILLAASPAAWGAGSHFMDVGARWHTESSAREDLPFRDGDVSYVVGYEYFENNAYWQLALGIAPEVTAQDVPFAGTTNPISGKPETFKDNTVDLVLTPQINLLFVDKAFFGGLGGYWSYVMRDGKRMDGTSASSEWSDFYGQFILGFSLPLGGFKLDICSYYPFADFDPFSDFEFSELEYGVLLKYRF